MRIGTSPMCNGSARSWLLRVIPEEPGDYFSMIAPFATFIFSLSKTAHTVQLDKHKLTDHLSWTMHGF